MKNLIALIISASLSMADAVLLEDQNITGTQIKTVCVDGYKFIFVKDELGISMTQVYEARGGTKPARPITCSL